MRVLYIGYGKYGMALSLYGRASLHFRRRVKAALSLRIESHDIALSVGIQSGDTDKWLAARKLTSH